MEKEILRVENISKSFGGVKALEDINLTISEGEILCLVGENGSGKSTLIKIISGIYSADQGDIYINQHQYKKIKPIESIKNGIQVIYQDFSLFPNLSVAENLAVNEHISSGKTLVNWKNIKEIAQRGLENIGISLDLDAEVGSLSTADRQLIAITKAIMSEAKLIIMDEPTTALTQQEIKSLFKIINDLKKRNISTLFVSHKLNEIREIADRIVIFRNGKKVMDKDAPELSIESMEYYMTGKKLDSDALYSESDLSDVNPILSVKNLTLTGKYQGVNFDLKPGEVLGITGLLGSGRNALALSLYGIHAADSGTVSINGKNVNINNIQDAKNNNIGFVPEDRVRDGIFLDQTIENNISANSIDRLVNNFKLVDENKKHNLAENWIKRFNIKTPSRKLLAKKLSGGNQQRVVLAKTLADEPKVLILNSPTVGVDVGSKAEILKLVRDLADGGMGILLISDDIPELMRTCDRIILMQNGKVKNTYLRDEIDEEKLNRAIVGDF
jgi:simple sugar transport system ATP-binding protein